MIKYACAIALLATIVVAAGAEAADERYAAELPAGLAARVVHHHHRHHARHHRHHRRGPAVRTARRAGQPLPPVKPVEADGAAEEKNIFNRFASSLMRPVGNCLEYDQVDARVRRVVADAAKNFNGVALLSSCYRDPRRNRRVGGARHSMHLVHKALDFVIQLPGGKLVDKYALARWVRHHPTMRSVGGVGTYCNTSAIHADVGARRNWSGGCSHSQGQRRWARAGA